MAKYNIFEDLIYGLELNTYEFMDFEKKVIKSLGKKNQFDVIKGVLTKLGVDKEDLNEATELVIKEFTKEFEIVEITELLSEKDLLGLKERKHKTLYLSNGRTIITGYVQVEQDGEVTIVSENSFNQIKDVKQLWEKRVKIKELK